MKKWLITIGVVLLIILIVSVVLIMNGVIVTDYSARKIGNSVEWNRLERSGEVIWEKSMESGHWPYLRLTTKMAMSPARLLPKYAVLLMSAIRSSLRNIFKRYFRKITFRPAR